MPFNIVGVKTAEDADHGGALHPVVGEEDSPYLIEIEPADGNAIEMAHATGVTISEITEANPTRQTIGQMSDLDIDIYVTDARVAIACAKFDKGGGWVGFSPTGLVVAAAANAASRARAIRRRRGQLLVGQVRYPWLNIAGATSRSGFGTSNGIRLGLREKTDHGVRAVFLDLELDKRTDAPALMQLITSRAAAYRLGHDIAPDHKKRAEFEQLARAGRLMPEPKKYASHKISDYWYAGESTAHLKIAGQ